MYFQTPCCAKLNNNMIRRCPATYRQEKILQSAGFKLVAGVDEVGCGCLAGPVYAAAVILPTGLRNPLIRDSKTLSPAQRFKTAEFIRTRALTWAVGTASVREIERLNIRRASLLAMQRALDSLSPQPDWILSDAFLVPSKIPCTNLIRGDAHVKCIAAASIIAKVARDGLMSVLDKQYPGYGFARHVGYGTPQHLAALKKLGPSPIHRKTFAPIKELLVTTH